MSVIPLSAQAKTFSQTLFNPTFYLANNPDVLTAVSLGLTTAFEHFSTFGHRENRPLLPFFDSSAYLLANPDVLAATTQPGWVSAWNHFVTFGILEGRSPNGTAGFTGVFDNAKYLAQNPDVNTAVTKNAFRNGFEHYLLFGSKEGRAAFNKDGTAIDLTSSVSPGKSFTLTTGVDVFTGTSGNDVFSGSTAGTFQAFDQLNGGGGKDILIAQGIGSLTTNATTLQGIERVEIYGMTAGATLGLANTTGVEEILISNALGDATVSGINSGIKSLEVIGNPIAGTADNFTFTLSNAAVSGTSDSVTLKLSGVGDTTKNDNVTVQPTSGVNGYETINIESLASPNFVTLDDGSATSLKTVTVKGDADLRLKVTPATLTKFDATDATGKQTVDLTTNTQNIEVIGGKGDDSFNFGNNLTKNDKVNGGDGRDTLQFNSASTTLTDTFQVQGIEILRISDALAGNLNVSKFGTSVNTVRLDADTGANIRTISKLGDNATLDLRAAQSLGAQHILALASTSGQDDKVTIALNGNYTIAGANTEDYRTVKVDNVELVTIQSNYDTNKNPDNQGDKAALTLDAAQAKELTITGKVGLDLTGSTITSVTKIDSTGLVPEVPPADTTAGDGGLTVTLATGANQTAIVTAGNGNNVIVSGAGDDNITTGSGADRVTIGTGKDKVNLGAGKDFLILTANGQLTSDDTVAGGDGTDILQLTTATITLADGAFTNLSGFERIEGVGGNAYNLNLGGNAAAAFNNSIRIDQGAVAGQVWNVNGAGLSSDQIIDFRGANTLALTADTIVGGAGNDKITGGLNSGTNGDVMTGGLGADIFFFRSRLEANGGAVAGDINPNKIDFITDFVAGVDTIQILETAFTLPLTTTSPTMNKGATVASFAAADFAAIQTAFNTAAQLPGSTATTVGWNIVEVTGAMAGTYVIVDLDGSAGFTVAGDLIVRITGVTGTFSGADFAFGNLLA